MTSDNIQQTNQGQAAAQAGAAETVNKGYQPQAVLPSNPTPPSGGSAIQPPEQSSGSPPKTKP